MLIDYQGKNTDKRYKCTVYEQNSKYPTTTGKNTHIDKSIKSTINYHFTHD